MKTRIAALAIGLTIVSCTLSVCAQEEATPPVTAADLEAAYTTAIERRADDILTVLALSDAAKAAKVRETVLTQYRALRARDEMIDRILDAHGKVVPPTPPERTAMFQSMSAPLHARFLARLSTELTPDQVEKVKDKMTYNKVKITYDAYCAIIPDLTDVDKAKVLDMLRAAREEAIDGGTSKEKSDIFQKYKDQINDYLNQSGHDVAKAYREWNAKQQPAKTTTQKPQ